MNNEVSTYAYTCCVLNILKGASLNNVDSSLIEHNESSAGQSRTQSPCSDLSKSSIRELSSQQPSSSDSSSSEDEEASGGHGKTSAMTSNKWQQHTQNMTRKKSSKLQIKCCNHFVQENFLQATRVKK